MELAQKIGAVWRYQGPIAEPIQAAQVLEDAGKVQLAAAVSVSQLFDDTAIPGIVAAAEAVRSNGERFDYKDFLQTACPHEASEWATEKFHEFPTIVTAGVGAIALGRTIKQLVRELPPREQTATIDRSSGEAHTHLTYSLPVASPTLHTWLTAANDGSFVEAISLTTMRHYYPASISRVTVVDPDFRVKLESANGSETIYHINASLDSNPRSNNASSRLHASVIRLKEINGTMLTEPIERTSLVSPFFVLPALLWQVHDALRTTKRWKEQASS